MRVCSGGPASLPGLRCLSAILCRVPIRGKVDRRAVHRLALPVREGVRLVESVGEVRSLWRRIHGQHVLDVGTVEVAGRVCDLRRQDLRLLPGGCGAGQADWVPELALGLVSARVLLPLVGGRWRDDEVFRPVEDQLELAILHGLWLLGRVLAGVEDRLLDLPEVLVEHSLVLGERLLGPRLWLAHLAIPLLLDSTVCEEPLPQHLEPLLASRGCIWRWDLWLSGLLLLPLKQLCALLVEHSLLLGPVLRHHLVEPVDREVCDLLLRDAGEGATDTLAEVNGSRVVDSDGLGVSRRHLLVELGGIVRISTIVPEERADADILRLVDAWMLDDLQAPVSAVER